VYYYATSHIGRKKARDFDPALLREFLEFYVHGFHDLCTALMTIPHASLSSFIR